jgi:hypothetical protein
VGDSPKGVESQLYARFVNEKELFSRKKEIETILVKSELRYTRAKEGTDFTHKQLPQWNRSQTIGSRLEHKEGRQGPDRQGEGL